MKTSSREFGLTIVVSMGILLVSCEPTGEQGYGLIIFSTIVAALGFVRALYISITEKGEFGEGLALTLTMFGIFFISAWIIGLLIIGLYNLSPILTVVTVVGALIFWVVRASKTPTAVAPSKPAGREVEFYQFAGKVVPVTNNVDEFVHIVRVEKKPIGLLVRIKDWMHVYGQLLHSATGTPNLFTISPSGTCSVICAQCNVELDPGTIAMLGPNSAISDFGVPPVNQCPVCGSTNIVIVSVPGRRKDKGQQGTIARHHDGSNLTPAAIRKLAQEGAEAEESLIAALQHEEDMGVRKAATRALGQIGDHRAIEPLLDIALCDNEDKPLRAEADKALVAIGEPALPATIAMLKRGDSLTRIQAADLLGKMGNPKAVAPLAATMHKEMKSSGHYVSASDYVTALGQIGGEAAAKALTEALQYPANRQAAARWLERIGAEAVAPLIAVLGDASVGKTAAKVLVKIGEPAVEPLIATLEDSDLSTHSAVVDVLRKLAADTTLEQSLREQASTAVEQLSDTGVLFVRKMKRDQATYELYTSSDAEKAKDFLLNKKVTRKFYYVEVETPNGTWGIDKDGMYLVELLPWQKNLSLGKYEGEISTWPSTHAVMVANQGLMDNAIAGIRCGKCEHEWWDGICPNESTIVRCPKCQTYNKIKGGKIHIHEITI